MESHPLVRVQFFLRGPFDNIETLSCTFLDERGEEQATVVEAAARPQYQLWQAITDHCAHHIRQNGHQLTLHIE